MAEADSAGGGLAYRPGAAEGAVDPAALKAELIERGVRFLLPSYADMHGASKAKMVPMSHFDQMMGGSELFTGAALDGVPQEVNEEEVAAHPDPGSCLILPWQTDIAWFASDLQCRGAAFEACSRNILNRVRTRAADMGYGMYLGTEIEFFVFREPETDGLLTISGKPHLNKPAYDVSRLLDNFHWIGDLVDAMNGLGWDVYSFDHEDAIGQFEIDFAYADALTMADRFVFFRRLADEMARRHGYFASFMPKPMMNYSGSGSHYNMSLYDIADGRNLFGDPGDPRGNNMAELGYRFIAGLLRHLPAIVAVTAPSVNSYKRLIIQGSMSGYTWAPVFRCYGGNNRTNSLRIPLAGDRIELRATDPMCNPYLGAAMVLAAGLEGVAEELDPGEPRMGNLYARSAGELAAEGIEMLPRSLAEALDAFEADPLSEAVFGPDMYQAWLSYKRQEWLDYMNHVSDWETDRYLRFY